MDPTNACNSQGWSRLNQKLVLNGGSDADVESSLLFPGVDINRKLDRWWRNGDSKQALWNELQHPKRSFTCPPPHKSLIPCNLHCILQIYYKICCHFKVISIFLKNQNILLSITFAFLFVFLIGNLLEKNFHSVCSHEIAFISSLFLKDIFPCIRDYGMSHFIFILPYREVIPLYSGPSYLCWVRNQSNFYFCSLYVIFICNTFRCFYFKILWYSSSGSMISPSTCPFCPHLNWFPLYICNSIVLRQPSQVQHSAM